MHTDSNISIHKVAHIYACTNYDKLCSLLLCCLIKEEEEKKPKEFHNFCFGSIYCFSYIYHQKESELIFLSVCSQTLPSEISLIGYTSPVIMRAGDAVHTVL